MKPNIQNIQQPAMVPNSMRYPTPVSNTLPGSGMMSPVPSPFDVNQGGMGHSNVGGGVMSPFDQQDVKPRMMPPSMITSLIDRMKCTVV
jgi:hypothetical protein